MINQKNREDIIRLLEKSDENLNLRDLFLFDLSPYYEEKQDNSFFSKQLKFFQEKNRLKHNAQISFMSEQIRLYEDIKNNDRLIVSAPTSFGKTMLIKEYIYEYLPNNVVFIVPTNSLADELLESFHELYIDLDYTIFDSTKNIDEIKGKNIFIGTQEKFYQVRDFYKQEIDLFIIDEAYKLSDKIKNSREVILNRVLIDIISMAQKIILLMPLVNSIKGLENFGFKISKSEFAPIAKNFFKVKNLKKKIVEEIKTSNSINLYYFNSPKEIEEFYDKELSDIQLLLTVNKDWIKRVEEDFHPDWMPILALKKGIGVHYGPLPKFIQKKVVELFNSKEIKNLLSTNSIIEGVNTPTQNIYITTSRDILGDKNLIKYKNLIGRAGRLGKYKVGNIYYDKKHKKQFEKANIPYKDINIAFVLEEETGVKEVNRVEEFDNSSKDGDSLSKENQNKLEHLKTITYKNVPLSEVNLLLDEHGFTLSQFQTILQYNEDKKDEKIYLLGIIGKVYYNIDKESMEIALNNSLLSFKEMVERLALKKKEQSKTMVVSELVKMIYNTLPFKIIPLIDFVLDINDLFKKFNEKDLLPNRVLQDAKKMEGQFYSKYIGDLKGKEDLLILMHKLFEYGIPYQRGKKYLEEIASELPDKFSIYDVRRIVLKNDSLAELKVYFE